MLTYPLEISRGARFDPIGWVLKRDGAPIRSIDGLGVVAKIRRHSGDDQVLHQLEVTPTLIVADRYGPDPVAVALLGGMTPAQTAALRFDRGVWDLMVNYERPMVGGLVTLPWVVSR
ncbi:hypothetical protein WY02_03445 [Pseudonocardia sp. AL041005-10]|nr:hypothetical protein [Pseudonocardia sp. AL041005-10]ALE77658.1 hypothetical protein WY02_03445 [Pseudonocardia sp. AL041005-10]